MTDLERLSRISRRARRVFRIRRGIEGAMVVAIATAACAFVVLLLAGLGFVGSRSWELVLYVGGAATLVGAVVAALRPLDERAVVRRVDADYSLGNSLSTAWEILRQPERGVGGAVTLAQAHVRQALERVEGLFFTRTVTRDLGPHARILGILYACIVSLALI